MPRNKSMIRAIQEEVIVRIYLAADEKNFITVQDVFGQDMELFMTDDGEIKSRRPGSSQVMDFPMLFQNWINIIDQLKDFPASDTGKFENRFAEIKFHTGVIKTLNNLR